MSLPVEKVELGFDSFAIGNWFTLDDPVKGLLDSPTYVLAGGTNYVDVTPYLSSLSINRGKSRALDRYSAGQASVTFDNRNRYFDPTYTASPFYGQIVPRRDIKIWANGQIVYYGTVEDWNLDYSPSGESTATVLSYDGFAFLAQQTLTAQTFTSQLSGARVNAVLSDASVGWVLPTNIDTGSTTLQGDAVSADNVLQYLQTIETTEPGELFVAKNGALTFQERNHAFTSAAAPLLSDDNTGINYSDVKVVYGSELLYTQLEISRKGSATIVQVNDTTAQATYGIRTLAEDGVLTNSDADTALLGNYLLGLYSAPEYRFESVGILLSQLSEANQNTLLNLDLGSVVKVTFTPNGVGSPIVRYTKVIAISHQVSLVEHRMVLGLGTLNTNTFILDDLAFGILDTSILAY